MITKLDVVFLGGMSAMIGGGAFFHEAGFVVMGIGAFVSFVALANRNEEDDGGEL